jgi:nucleoside-diphosphate-sugar epimerase
VKILVTGATGYLGSGIVRALVEAGHEVAGLTRLAENAAYLQALGANAVVGDLRQPATYRHAADSADALIHAAQEDSPARQAADRMAVEALIEAARNGRARVLVYTSGCFVLGETGEEPVGEEASTESAPPYAAWRREQEQRILAAGDRGLATAVIRPGMVYGGKEGAFASFFATAERDGAAEFIGDGTNHWSPVYRGDMARLYRQVVEREGRGIFHCAERAARVGDLAIAASRAAGAGGATRRRRLEEARKELGDFADALTLDQLMGCPRARAFGWAPEHPHFLEGGAVQAFSEWKEPSRPSGS